MKNAKITFLVTAVIFLGLSWIDILADNLEAISQEEETESVEPFAEDVPVKRALVSFKRPADKKIIRKLSPEEAKRLAEYRGKLAHEAYYESIKGKPLPVAKKLSEEEFKKRARVSK